MKATRSEISAWITEDPARAREAILAALRATDGFQRRAAVALGVHEATLCRWIEKLDMKGAVAAVVVEAKQAGRFDPRGRGATGRPRSTS